MEGDRMTFGALFRETRERAGKSMGDIARHLKVTVPFVSDVERGRRGPFTTEKVIAASNLLGVAPDRLLQAAAKDRKTIELSAAGARPKMLQVGAGLMRHWKTLTDKQLEEIEKVLGESEEDQ